MPSISAQPDHSQLQHHVVGSVGHLPQFMTRDYPWGGFLLREGVIFQDFNFGVDRAITVSRGICECDVSAKCGCYSHHKDGMGIG